MATADLDLGRYALGWSDAEDYVFKPKKGLNEDIVREIAGERSVSAATATATAFHHRGTEDTEKARPSEPTEAGAVSKTLEAPTDFSDGLGRVSSTVMQFSVLSVPLW